MVADASVKNKDEQAANSTSEVECKSQHSCVFLSSHGGS